MTAAPQTNGAPIQPPRIGATDCAFGADSLRIVKLTSYRFRDDSEYIIRDFDYRLRWTLYADHRSTTVDGTIGHLHATAEVWSRRDQEWHPVWELSREGASPSGADWKTKVSDWNRMLSTLAQYVTEVLT